MCGRFVNTHTTQELAEYFAVADATRGAIRPDYNVSPMRLCGVVLRDREGVVQRGDRSGDQRGDGIAGEGGELGEDILIAARWGLVPRWARDDAIGARMFNARSETVAEKPSYRAAFSHRRCLVPASGYYEWQKLDGDPKQKQPWYIHGGGEPIAFAGLWEVWSRHAQSGKGSEDLMTFTILTTDAPKSLADIHDRAPVVVHPELFDDWMDPETPKQEILQEVLGRNGVGDLGRRRVGKAVGSVRNNGPELLHEIDNDLGFTSD